MRTNKRSIDSNPRRGISRTPKEIRIYKPWTIKGQAVKILELQSPLTPRQIFKLLVENYIVSDNDIGLQSTRKVINCLEREGTVIIWREERWNMIEEHSNEHLISLRPERKYKWKELE